MEVSVNDYRLAQRLFYNLLNTGEFNEKDDRELYLAYLNNEGIKRAVDIISDEFKSDIKSIGDTIYLIPNVDNNIIGFDYREESSLMKNREHCYLTYLIITIVFAEFTNDISPATYINIVDIVDLVTDTLDRAMKKSNIEDEELNADFNVVRCNEVWGSKGTWDDTSKKGKKTTSIDYKIGFIRRVVVFLKQKGLIRVISDEDKIVPSNKFNELMRGYFLDNERKELIENLLSLKEEDRNAENK